MSAFCGMHFTIFFSPYAFFGSHHAHGILHKFLLAPADLLVNRCSIFGIFLSVSPLLKEIIQHSSKITVTLVISPIARIFLVLSSEKKSAGSTCHSVTFPVKFFYFKMISILLLPQALPLCNLHIIYHLHCGFVGFFGFYPKF